MIKYNKLRTTIIIAVAILFMVSIASAATDYDKISKHKKAKFYVKKSHYHEDQEVKFTLQNKDKKRSIFIPCDGEIEVVNKKYGNTYYVEWELDGCDTGYDDEETFELEPKEKVDQYWDWYGDGADKGKYKAYTQYLDEDDNVIKVKTGSFKLKS